MKFICKKDGGCDLVFEKHEIDIIKDKEKLTFTKEFFENFSNAMMKVIMEWNIHINNSRLTPDKDSDK